MRKITILYIDHYPEMSGGQKGLLTRLKYLDKSEFLPVVICPSKGLFYRNLVELGINVYTVGMNKYDVTEVEETNIYRQPLRLAENIPIIIKAIRQIRNIALKEGVDIIHSNSFKGAVLGAIVSKLINKPFLFRAQVNRFWSNHGWLDNLVCHCAERIVVNSRFTGRSFSQWKDKTFVLYPSIDFKEFDPTSADDDAIKKEFGINNQTKLIGMIAWISARKRQEDFILAASKIATELPKVKFMLVGGIQRGHRLYFEKVKKLIKDLDLTNKVIVTGFREHIPNIMAALDAMVLTSLCESFGRVIVEALICGTPIVATNDGGIPEIIENGKQGWLVPPKNSDLLARKILNVLNNEEIKATVRSRESHQVLKRRFSAKALIKKEEHLYRKVSRTSSKGLLS